MLKGERKGVGVGGGLFVVPDCGKTEFGFYSCIPSCNTRLQSGSLFVNTVRFCAKTQNAFLILQVMLQCR